jgi:predicted dehydrogenase
VSKHTPGGLSRREMLKTTGGLAAASALAGVVLPQVHAGQDSTIQVALVGAGGRGTGAVENALSVARYGPIKLVAIADVFQNRLNNSVRGLTRSFAKQMDVPDERKFIGFDGYQKAMDCLKPNDVAIFATPPAFRWVHFKYAIEKGLNVFMEKPVAVDGPSSKKMFALAEEAEKKNLKVGVGLMCRHSVARGELFKRIRDGEMGDLTLLRAYRVKGPEGSQFSPPKPANVRELQYQIQRFHSFLWASGGCYSDFLIHNIDECCWMKDAWPVQAKAVGGRHYRGNNIDQNFDNYAVEYTFADGAKLMLEGRNMPDCWQEFASYAHGTKGSALISENGHAPAYCRIYKGQNIRPRRDMTDLAWMFGRDEQNPNGRAEPDPYQTEWDDLIAAIRHDKPYNEVKRGTEASLVTAMGRMAAHTGQIITRDQILNHDHEFAPDVDKLTLESDAPLKADADGKYPVPEPGKKKLREY